MRGMKARPPRHFLDLDRFDEATLRRMLDRALVFKRTARKRRSRKLLQGRTLAMVFEKPSTRTRVSFETGMTQLGGHAVFLGPDDIHLGHGEPVKDTARALSRYVDVIMARLFDHADLDAPTPVAGFEPGEDIEIRVTGMRPGEKLFEEIFHSLEKLLRTGTDGVLLASPTMIDLPLLVPRFSDVIRHARTGSSEALLEAVHHLVPEFKAAPLGPAEDPSSTDQLRAARNG